MKLSTLLDELSQKALSDLEISSITSNSKEVRLGSLFIATQGLTSDAHDFIPVAFQQGARFCIGEKKCPAGIDPSLYLQVPDSKKALGLVASAFYGHPSRKMQVYAVTGTSGKTTTSFLMESVLRAKNHRVGLIGTVLYRVGDRIITSTHTTPGAVEIQKLFYEMLQAGCDSVVMEVSSHALKQERAWGICFDGAIFTNLTPEHLDYHPDMADYFAAKARLFTDYADYAHQHGKKKFVASVNAADSYGMKLIELLSKKKQSFISVVPFDGSSLSVTSAGVTGDLHGVSVKSGLTGSFNGFNIAGVVELFRGMGFPVPVISKGIESLTGVPGRLESVPNTHGITVLVDYAHKPDALEKVLKALRPMVSGGRLITVFGCGGDRDKTKRPVMGRLAAELSDLVFVTSDNPRTEQPAQIIQEILGGISDQTRVQVMEDRRAAIGAAVSEARTGDLILIAGKGHEDYQIIGTEKQPFDDRVVAREALDRR